jgi:hypothetical protein
LLPIPQQDAVAGRVQAQCVIVSLGKYADKMSLGIDLDQLPLGTGARRATARPRPGSRRFIKK